MTTKDANLEQRRATTATPVPKVSKKTATSERKTRTKKSKSSSTDQQDQSVITAASSSSSRPTTTRSIKSSSVAPENNTTKKNPDSFPSALDRDSNPKPITTVKLHISQHPRSTQSPSTTTLKKKSSKKPSVKKLESEQPGSDGSLSSSTSKSKRLSFDGTVIPSPPTPHRLQEKLPIKGTDRSYRSARSITDRSHQSTRSFSSYSANASIASTQSNDKNHHHVTKQHQKIKKNSKNMESKKVPVESASLVKGYPEVQIERSLEVPQDEVTPYGSTPSKKSNKKVIWLSAICFVVIAAAVAVPCVLLLGGSDGSSSGSFPRLSKVDGGTVVASIERDICDEDIPGSGSCTPSGSNEEKQGGELCNLLAKSMINTTVYGDIALINAGICQQGLLAPDVTADNIEDAIVPKNLVAVEISGIDLSNILTQAATASFGASGNPEAYPYAAGLRYTIQANLPPSERVSNIEVSRGLRDDVWEPIVLRQFYTVITTESLANGGMGYDGFGSAIDDWKNPLNIKTGDAFYNYANNAMTIAEDAEWSVLPDSEYSTQYFVGEDEEAILGAVPTLICHALIPGEPESPLCTAADVANGGEVCNLVSWAIYDQNLGFDIVMLEGGVCAGDIEDGYLLESKIDSALTQDHSLVTAELLGSEVVALVEDLVSTAVGGAKEDYPYAAGLRFDVNRSSSPKVSNVQFLTPNGSWIPIVATNTYTVATTPNVVTSSSTKDTNKSIKEEIISYADEWETIYKPPAAKSSTQSYA